MYDKINLKKLCNYIELNFEIEIYESYFINWNSVEYFEYLIKKFLKDSQ